MDKTKDDFEEELDLYMYKEVDDSIKESSKQEKEIKEKKEEKIEKKDIKKEIEEDVSDIINAEKKIKIIKKNINIPIKKKKKKRREEKMDLHNNSYINISFFGIL